MGSCRGPGRGCVHRWTSARKRPKKSHFFSLFGPPGVIPTCRDSISKSFHAKQIGPDTWSSRASKTPCGTWDPKFSYRFSLIVHYLAVGSGQWKKFGRVGQRRLRRATHHVIRWVTPPSAADPPYHSGRGAWTVEDAPRITEPRSPCQVSRSRTQKQRPLGTMPGDLIMLTSERVL